MSVTRKPPKFIAIDFFCGAGGTTCGLMDAGGYVVAGIDHDQRCKDTYEKNNKNKTGDKANASFLCFDIFPKSKMHPNGQQKELMNELRSRISLIKSLYPTLPMLFAICAPCQPFTTVSKKELTAKRKQKRAQDQDLLKQALKFVAEFSPEFVLSENVSGISSDRFGGVWQRFENGLHRLGYATGSDIVCASNFGIPQYRKRSILLGAKDQKLPESLMADRSSRKLRVPTADPKSRKKCVKDAIGWLPPLEAGCEHPSIANHKTRSLSDLNKKRISVAVPGETNKYLDNTIFGDLSLNCHRKVNKKLGVRCFNDVYTRMRGDQPSPTITTKCHSISNGRFGHFDTKQTRGISLREAALLQSFPKTYVFYPTDKITHVAIMIGNAVPPRLAKFFASYLVNP